MLGGGGGGGGMGPGQLLDGCVPEVRSAFASFMCRCLHDKEYLFLSSWLSCQMCDVLHSQSPRN